MSRRACLLFWTLWIACFGAHAQQYPAKTVQVIIANGPGSGMDFSARLLINKLSSSYGQSFVAVNRPGGGGVPAAQQVMGSPADGYTLLVTSDAQLATALVNPNLGFDPTKSMASIGTIVAAGALMVVSSSLNIRTMDEFIKLAKSRPGQLNYSSFEAGHLGHLWMELFLQQAGLQLTHVPYKTGPDIVQAVATGDAAMTIAVLSSAQPLITAGRVVPIMYLGQKPKNAFLDVPPTSQLFPGLIEPIATICLMGPFGLPRDIVASLNAEIRKALQAPDALASLEKVALVPSTSAPEDLQKHLENMRISYANIMKKLGIGPK